MKCVRLTVLSLLLSATRVHGQKPAENRITSDVAQKLVMGALTPQQRRLPELGLASYEAPQPSLKSKYLFYTVHWKGRPDGSVVVGNWAVDPRTGDVFNAASNHEEQNKRLQQLQARVRASLHLSAADYRRLKTKGPLEE